MGIHDGISQKTISRFNNKVYHKFFSTNKETVDSEIEEKESKSQKPNSSHYEKFNTPWLNDYRWLKHDSEKGMLCELCISSGKQSSFTTGCTNSRTLSLTSHAESTDHRNALLACTMQKFNR